MSATSEACHCSKNPDSSTRKLPAFLSDPKVYAIATLVIKVAVTLFALILAPIPTLIGLGVGIAAGIGYQLYTNSKMPEALELQPVCAKGYAEMLAQTQFPPMVNLGITTFSLAACVTCQTLFFAPFVGVLSGFYIGQKGTECIRNLFNSSVKPVTVKAEVLVSAY